ncbi:MAG TPA: DUF2975 domain-containing protein [Mucilaginibacter sp.]|jgi:hypothetical protein|nr:DUF2975 domain-containing protein [Mucilaginibacter sp.]
MKIKLSTNLIVNIVIVGYGALMLVTWMAFSFFAGSGSVQHGIDTNNFGYNHYRFEDKLKPVDEDIPDSISYREYTKREDSIKLLRGLKNGDQEIGGMSFGCLGTAVSLYCDTDAYHWFWKVNFFSHKADHDQYFIELPGWKIKDAKWFAVNQYDSVLYHVEHNQSYLRKSVRFPNQHLVRLEDIPVKFKYNSFSKALKIPVSPSVEYTVGLTLQILGILFLLYSLYLISAFLKFVIDLSKGLFFTAKNLRRLRLIAFTLLIYPVALFLINLIIQLIFHSYFSPDVVMNTDMWKDAWKPILTGLIFLALWKAFRQGKKLKEEQELTI